MSKKQLGKELDKAESTTQPSDNDNPRESSSQVSISELGRPVVLEHNYSVLLPKLQPSKRNLPQLICSLHDKIRPRASEKLSSAKLSQHIRYGHLFLRRMRRLLASHRRFIEFEPMTPLQEAIAQELAKEMGCETRLYNIENARYMVAYRPGTKPNPYEVRARQLSQTDGGLEIFIMEGAQRPLEPMSFRDNKLHWHQPTESKGRPVAANPEQDSLLLGRKILEEFNRQNRPKGVQKYRNCDQENKEPKTT